MITLVRPNEAARYKEIFAMDVIAKLLKPIALTNVVQAIRERCHA
jgi:hypothetical protein